jgi:hypothetical protein
VCQHSFLHFLPSTTVWNHFELQKLGTLRGGFSFLVLGSIKEKVVEKMLVKELVAGLLALAAITEASVVHRSPIEAALLRRQNGRNGRNGGNNGGNQGSNTGGNNANLCLNANAVQTGSESTGQQNGVAADGQVNSAT